MMAKVKRAFVCSECGAEFSKWQGRCSECGAWNSLQEIRLQTVSTNQSRAKGYAGVRESRLCRLSDIEATDLIRWPTGMRELDRVLGGGLVPGEVALIGGDPGVGKSTLLLQTLLLLSERYTTLYVTGEESPQQVALRAARMHLKGDKLNLLAETEIASILEQAARLQPQVMVVDSIQTMHLAEISSAPGSVSQVRESAAALTRFAKQNQCAIFLVGHVTKAGEVAGPRVLEHIVDAVLFLEGEADGRFRTLRALKNRFGAVNELGVFAMTEQGMKQVKNPSAIFLSREVKGAPGSVVMVMWEGTRPLLVELQALVDTSPFGAPRRVTVGLDQNRLAMLLAVLHRHGGIQAADQDVYLNVVGGVKITETAADLAILAAILSSLRGHPLPDDLIVFGEVGLAGEIRPVRSGQERIAEAVKHGFRHALVPWANRPRQAIEGMSVTAVRTLADAVAALTEM